MQLKIYSIRDSKGEFFNQPFFQRTDEEAHRSFTRLRRDASSMIHQFPQDFDLWILGSFDDQTGVITPLPAPQHFCNAIGIPKEEKWVDGPKKLTSAEL